MGKTRSLASLDMSSLLLPSLLHRLAALAKAWYLNDSYFQRVADMTRNVRSLSWLSYLPVRSLPSLSVSSLRIFITWLSHFVHAIEALENANPNLAVIQ